MPMLLQLLSVLLLLRMMIIMMPLLLLLTQKHLKPVEAAKDWNNMVPASCFCLQTSRGIPY